MTGYIHIYTGNGKGKTTAALGLALRAVGAGLRVYFGQFMKNFEYSEIRGLGMLGPSLLVEQFGRRAELSFELGEEDRLLAGRGLERVQEILKDGNWDLVILDEIVMALHFGLLRREAVLALVQSRPKGTELVLTGRHAPRWLIRLADLVTEMREIKHYFREGVRARAGIEK